MEIIELPIKNELMNVSEQLLQILQQEGVRHIFGVAGDALNPLISAIGKQDTIQWVRVKHEGNASYAAFAQGELNGNLGVCASTVGPGALHLINGLYNAKKERSPVLAITGQVPVRYIGTNYHQEADLQKIFDDVCDYQAVIRSPEEAPGVVMRALRIAINKKTVCRIELPSDIAMMKARNQQYVSKVFRSDSLTIPPDKKLKQAAKLINEAEKIAIFGGAGCREAKDIVLKFADKIKAPITHTLRASDVFDHDMDQVVGLTGLIGNPSGYKAVMESELLIMLGTDFPYDYFLPKDSQIIQIDIREENIGNRVPVNLGLHGDIGAVVSALEPICSQKKDDSFMKDRRKEFLHWKKKIKEEADPKRKMEPIHPQIFTGEVNQHASDDAIIAIDTGTSAIWASNYMSFYKDRRIIGSFNHGSMAVGLPASIGAQLQYPEREVWAFIGDGAFNMTLHDFSTAVEYGLPIKIIVFNNSQLGFVKIEMEEAGLAPNLDALQVKNFNFAEFAKLLGGDGVRVEHAKDVTAAVLEAKKSNKPFIIDAIVNSGQLSLPPRIGFKEVKGFGISKAREMFDAVGGDKKQWDNIKKEIEGFFN